MNDMSQKPKIQPEWVIRIIAAVLSGPSAAAYLAANMAGGVSIDVSSLMRDSMIIAKGVADRCEAEGGGHVGN